MDYYRLCRRDSSWHRFDRLAQRAIRKAQGLLGIDRRIHPYISALWHRGKPRRARVLSDFARFRERALVADFASDHARHLSAATAWLCDEHLVVGNDSGANLGADYRCAANGVLWLALPLLNEYSPRRRCVRSHHIDSAGSRNPETGAGLDRCHQPGNRRFSPAIDVGPWRASRLVSVDRNRYRSRSCHIGNLYFHH